MEVNKTTEAPARPPDHNRANNGHTQGYHHSHSQTNSHHGTSPSISVLIIIISITSLAVLFAIVLFIIIMLRRLKSAKSKGSCKEHNGINMNTNSRFIAHTTVNFYSSPDVRGGCLYGGHMGRTPPSKFRGVQVYTYKELEVATDRFSEANIIGNGGCGVVYRGVLSDGTVAAIKMLHREGKQGERAFRIEVDLLSRLHCPYLVELLGYCADQHHRLLIFEFMPNGTLQHHLHPSNNQHKQLDWGTRLRIALDCARALEFLHEQSIPTPVIHHDFKCTNVLIDQNFRAKVSDFGLAKMCSDKITGQISTRVLGTTGYLAPERPTGEHVLVSWALPRLSNREKVVEMVDPSLQGQYSKKDLIQIAAIAAMCVQPEADYRPLMTDVVQSLIPLVKNLYSINSSGSSRFLNQAGSPRR